MHDATARPPPINEGLPVRVARTAWARVFHPSLDQLEEAVAHAIEDGASLRFYSIDKLEKFIMSRVRAELCVDVGCEFDADEVDARDKPTGGRLLSVHTRRIGPVYVLIAAEKFTRLRAVPTDAALAANAKSGAGRTN